MNLTPSKEQVNRVARSSAAQSATRNLPVTTQPFLPFDFFMPAG